MFGAFIGPVEIQPIGYPLRSMSGTWWNALLWLQFLDDFIRS